MSDTKYHTKNTFTVQHSSIMSRIQNSVVCVQAVWTGLTWYNSMICWGYPPKSDGYRFYRSMCPCLFLFHRSHSNFVGCETIHSFKYLIHTHTHAITYIRENMRVKKESMHIISCISIAFAILLYQRVPAYKRAKQAMCVPMSGTCRSKHCQGAVFQFVMPNDFPSCR